MSIQFGKPTVTINGTPIPVESISVSHDLNTTAPSYEFTTFSTSACVATDLGDGMWNQSCTNHTVCDSLIEYQDDLVVAYCINCDARIVIGRVPGGVNKLKMANILAIMRENPDADVLESIIDLEHAVRTEIEELQNALILLEAAKDQACKQLLP